MRHLVIGVFLYLSQVLRRDKDWGKHGHWFFQLLVCWLTKANTEAEDLTAAHKHLLAKHCMLRDRALFEGDMWHLGIAQSVLRPEGIRSSSADVKQMLASARPLSPDIGVGWGWSPSCSTASQARQCAAFGFTAAQSSANISVMAAIKGHMLNVCPAQLWSHGSVRTI